MRVVLDTNVFVSGIFFSGPPHRILNAWRHGQLRLVYSPEIFQEYDRVLAELSATFRKIDASPFLDLLARYGEQIEPTNAINIDCRDPADIKFVACLIEAKASCLISGDKDLLMVKADRVSILSPRQFCDLYL